MPLLFYNVSIDYLLLRYMKSHVLWADLVIFALQVDLIAIAEWPDHHVSVQLCLPHAALPEESFTSAAAATLFASLPDVLARPGRETRSLPLSGRKFLIV